MSRAVGCIIAIFLACSTASAQNPGTLTPGQPGASPGAAAPPRDNPNAGKGTATLRGHVVAADTGQPLRKAQVRIISSVLGPAGPQNRATATDGSGKYEFKDLAAGRYTVSVSKGSYINLSYGQRRPNEPGKPIELLDGQTVEKIDFALPRGAILTGSVIDELGEPAENVQLSLMQSRNVQGRPQLVNAGRIATTNDLGQFRIVGVPPGQYYLSATMRNFPGIVESDDRTGYAPTYYPGTPSIGEAQRLTLTVGQTLNDLAITMVPARTARITGVALNSQGRPMTSGNIIVGQRNTGVAGGGFFVSMGGLIRPDGSFSLSGLAPGDYTLSATTQAGFGEAPESASAQVTLAGQDVDGVQLLAAKLSQLTGRIVTSDAASAQSLQPGALRLALTPKDPEPIIGPGGGPGRINDDLTFVLQSRPGATRVNLVSVGPGTSSGWTLKAVRLDGVDVTDAGIDVKVNEDITGLEIELTNRVSVLSGIVTGSRGEPVSDYSSVVFSQDRERWSNSSRYFRTSRADQDGRYKVTGLPAGDYFAIALDDSVDPNDVSSPEFLERASSRAVRFSLGDAETKSLDLKLTNIDR